MSRAKIKERLEKIREIKFEINMADHLSKDDNDLLDKLRAEERELTKQLNTELIVVKDDVALLDLETTKKIADFERKMKEIKDAEETLREMILEEMEEKGIKKIETEDFSITYRAPYDKESFQSKEFRAEHPDLYDSYVKMSPCKASVTIKLKEDKK